jgi:hypothetical protein
MTMVYKVANGELETPKESLPSFWQENLCFCPKFKVTKAQVEQYSWWKDKTITTAPIPEGCGTCGKWPRSNLRICNECGIHFYKQFRTSLMPLDWQIDCCWGCIHIYGNYPPWKKHPWFEAYPEAGPPDRVFPPRKTKAELDALFKF